MEVSEGFTTEDYRPTGPDGRGWGKYRQKTEDQLRLMEGYAKNKA